MLKINDKGTPSEPAYTNTHRPTRGRFVMLLYVWLRSLPHLLWRRHRFEKINMERLERPYLLLSSHACILDFKVVAKHFFPTTPGNVIALDAGVKRLKPVVWTGSFLTRKFSQDPTVARNILHVLRKNKRSMVLFPEARHTLDGRQNVIPDSLAKLVKLTDVPVVVLINAGHHLVKPYWHPYRRKLRSASTLTQILTRDEVRSLPLSTINEKIREAFQYDDYAWQKAENIHIREPERAVGLENILYWCPDCQTESQMHTQGTTLMCQACESTYTLSELGALVSKQSGKTRTVADWYDAQKARVDDAIHQGSYRIDTEVDLYILPNIHGFIPLGKARFQHDANGLLLTFTVDGVPQTVLRESPHQMAIHVAYKHHHNQNFIGYSVNNMTYFLGMCDPTISVTKISLAVETLYRRSRPMPPQNN